MLEELECDIMNEEYKSKYKIPVIQGWTTDNELNWLYDVSLIMDSIVEIGCWKGKSTHALLSGCKGPVFTVDHFKGNSDQLNSHHIEANSVDISKVFYQNVGHFSNLCLLKMDSIQASKFFKEKSIDMIFFDGGHLKEEIIADVLAWKPIVKKLLCGHDFQEFAEPALDELGIIPDRIFGGIWSVIL